MSAKKGAFIHQYPRHMKVGSGVSKTNVTYKFGQKVKTAPTCGKCGNPLKTVTRIVSKALNPGFINGGYKISRHKANICCEVS